MSLHVAPACETIAYSSENTDRREMEYALAPSTFSASVGENVYVRNVDTHMTYIPSSVLESLPPAEAKMCAEVAWQQQFQRETADARRSRWEAEAKMREDRAGIAEVERERIFRETPQYIPIYYSSPVWHRVTIHPDAADYDTPYVPYKVINSAPDGWWR